MLNPFIDFYAEYTVLANRTVMLLDNGTNVRVDIGSGGGSLVMMAEDESVRIYEAL